MSVLYVSSVDGNNADDGSSWSLAKQTVAGALSALAGAGPHTVYVDSAHNFTANAAITWTAPANSQVIILSVDRAGGDAYLAGATESIGTGANAFTIGSAAFSLIVRGMTLNMGTGSGATGFIFGTANVPLNLTFLNCNLRAPNTSSSGTFIFGPTSGQTQTNIVFRDCPFILADNSTISAINLRAAKVFMAGVTFSYFGSNKPANLFTGQAATAKQIDIVDSDISGYEKTGGNLFALGNLDDGYARFVNCKLSANPTITSGTWRNNTFEIILVNCDSGDTHNVFEYRNRLGTLTENGTNYANNGARFDGSGISWEIVTTAACSEFQPFITPWIHRWLEDSGSAKDIDLELIRDNATDFTDKEVWGEFDYLGSASFPNGTLGTTRNANPVTGTGADLTNSSETWTESLTNDNEMRVRVSPTPAEKSIIRARLAVAVASVTLYLDPMIRISGQDSNCPTRWSPEGAFNAEPAAVGGGGAGSIWGSVVR